METICMQANKESIAIAARLIQGGKCVALPTETVYGLAANALDSNAVSGIFIAKNRPADNPLIVHIASTATLSFLTAEIPKAAVRLAEEFWPGPLTIILKKSGVVPNAVTAGLSTVAIRFPSNPIMLAVIRESGLPLAAPSANKSGAPSPTLARHVMQDLSGAIPLVIDGGQCKTGIESTVIDVSGDTPTLLRPGIITLEQLRNVLGNVAYSPAKHLADYGNLNNSNNVSNIQPLEAVATLKTPDTLGRPAMSPGMKYKHYSPKAILTLVTGSDAQRQISELYEQSRNLGQKAAVLCFDETKYRYENKCVFSLGSLARLETVAENAFAVLRELDEHGIERVFCETVAPEGIGLAVMDRLIRAAGYNIIQSSC